MTSIICMSISHKPLLNAVSSLYLICYTLNIKYIMFTLTSIAHAVINNLK